MLIWFLRQRGADKLAVVLVAVVVIPVLWTALASCMLIALLGAHAHQIYPLSDPTTYFQWWVFLFDAAPSAKLRLWLAVSGVAAAAPFVAFALRQMMDYFGTARTPLIYGKTHWATPAEMKANKISSRRKPF